MKGSYRIANRCVPRSNSFERVLSITFIFAIATISLGADIHIDVTPIKTQAVKPENRVKKIIEIHKTSTPPVIDGKLNDECWKTAAVADGFVLLGSDAPAREQTAAKLTYDDKALYVAFVCKESRMDEILEQKTQHDDGVWQDDCIEIFLDTNHDHLSYYQFIVNPLGTRQEGYHDGTDRIDQKWNGTWEAKTSRGKNQWIAEVAIPFDTVGAKPGYWGINLCREEKPRGELGCWAKQERHFASTPDELARFGDAVFDELPVVVRGLFTGNQGWGANEFKIELENRKDKAAQYDILLTVVSPDGAKAEAEFDGGQFPAKAVRSVDSSYTIAKLVAGRWTLAVSLRDRDAGQICLVGGFPFEAKDVSPLSISGKVIIGPEYVVPARLHAGKIGRLTIKKALCRITVFDPQGRKQADRDIPLYPALYPCGEAEVRIDISSLPEGRYVVAALIVDKGGKPVTDTIEKTIIKIPGPFEGIEEGPANRVDNPSFEIANKEGGPEGWAGAWWARKDSGLEKVPVKDFLSVDNTTAKEGKHSIRIRSTRDGKVATSEVLTVRTVNAIPITPGVSYKLTCWWKSDGIVGIGKIWAQTPKRQFLFKGTINGTNPDWILNETTFTPDEGETSCRLNFSLHGKAGTLWIDQITFGEEAPSIQRILPPNPFKPEGVCLLGGNVVGRGLTLAVEAIDAASGQTLGSATVRVDNRVVRFTIPNFEADRKCQLRATLVDRSGKAVDTKTSMVFGASLAGIARGQG
ncbi:MAG: carbohydrate binding family 9 domain-containing protein [Planctomycetes bacterium]|nr:carbohydrate binding family 9 domain-containing protein [Planctomycetota bacterium]